LMGAVQRKGRTLVPLKLYFDKRGLAKLLLGIGTGKKQVDKRQTQKARDWSRQKARVMKERG
ncbi:MAG: SsrA-binding protein, partial [Robiginitomaculum sp.]|nr:SsrA-binding protein [Robiginitomaculum sp.]